MKYLTCKRLIAEKSYKDRDRVLAIAIVLQSFDERAITDRDLDREKKIAIDDQKIDDQSCLVFSIVFLYLPAFENILLRSSTFIKSRFDDSFLFRKWTLEKTLSNFMKVDKRRSIHRPQAHNNLRRSSDFFQFHDIFNSKVNINR